MKLTSEAWRETRLAGWRDGAGRWTAAWITFLTLTGLSLHFLPFSVFNQHALLVHTVLGLVLLPPVVIYLVRHVLAYRGWPGTWVKLSGWLSTIALAACVVSGIVLTWEAVLGRRITYSWRTIHTVGTYAIVPSLGLHLGAVYWRDLRLAVPEMAAAARGHAKRLAGWTAVGMLVTLVMSAAIRPVPYDNSFPADYDAQPYEGAGPFSPSLASTSTGGAFDSKSLGDSATCGTSGCHEEIYKEWLPSAHRYASMDVGFQKIQSVMAQQNGATSTRYCAGCHDPISLFSGTKNIGSELTNMIGHDEGISCMACHAIEQTDVSGNADYVMAQPERYVWELKEGGVAGFLRDFTMRAYPDHHVATLSRRMFKTPEFCAACHKQFIDEEVNQVGWVQLQNQFDNWKASRWHHEDTPERTIECRECHMPLVDSTDPAAGDGADWNRTETDGKHRSHRFLGANQYIPVLMGLEGAEEHARLTEAWLRGELEIPEIADRWSEGPAVPIALEVPDSAREGEELALRAHVINNKVGHDFPTGPLDIIQAWIEIEVTDADGTVVFHSGAMDERNRIDEGSFMFKAEPVDRYGNLIDRHNLWEMVGVRFKRSMFPGAEEVASYDFVCSGSDEEPEVPEIVEEATVTAAAGLTSPLTVKARLKYRKFDQFLLDFAFGEDAGLTAPVTVVSETEAVIPLVVSE